MDILRPRRLWALPAPFFSNPGLPPGIPEQECDGPASPLDDLTPDELWDRCPPIDQELLCMHFVESRMDALAEAILDLEEASATFNARPQPDPPGARASPSVRASGGLRLWQLWIDFRDRKLAEMRRVGDLDDPGPDA